ncbi:unnamed protein product, partial [Vitis vinifera]
MKSIGRKSSIIVQRRISTIPVR